MQSITVNRTESNILLKRVGDEITHALDLIREAFLRGETADFSYNDDEWSDTLNSSEKEIRTENTGPTNGVLTDTVLFEQVRVLYHEYQYYKSLQRLGGPTAQELENIRNLQVKHRQEDLNRLAHEFIESGYRKGLEKVLNADPQYALEPQLGFDPDEF